MSRTVRTEVGEFLKKNGLDVAYAVDGRDGLGKVKADPSLMLIVCDVNIGMLTTENSPSMKGRGKNVGVKGWIVKPFNDVAVPVRR
jgi:two-component system chemotaxis response regulator CheY